MRPLSIALLLAAAVSAEEVKYDDGQPDGARKFGDVGCGTWFDGPVSSKALKIHAKRGACRQFDVAAFDKDGNVLKEAAFDGGALPEKAGWAELEFKLESEEGLLVVVTFVEGQEGEMSWDKSEDSHSTFFYGGRHHPYQEGNWMIRLTDAPRDAASPAAFKPPPIAPGVVVKTDGGEELGMRRSDAGQAVRIDRPAGSVLTGVEIYAARTGRLARPFEAIVCDDRLRPILSMTLPCGLIGTEEKWYSVPFAGALQVPEHFWLVFNFRPTAADWISVGVCRNEKTVCSEALPGSVFRKFPPGESWMVRAHFAAGAAGNAAPPPAGTAEDGQIVAEVSKVFFKAIEKLDRGRLVDILADDAPGFDWLRSDEAGPYLDGMVHRRFTKEIARDVTADRATLVFATLRGPLYWDPPPEFRDARPANNRLPPGKQVFTFDAPLRHTPAEVMTLQLRKSKAGWALFSWDEVDLRDVAWGAGILADVPSGEAAVAALLKARTESIAAIEEGARSIEDPAQKARQLRDVAQLWGEDGDVAKWSAIAKELPDDDRAMLEDMMFVEGRRCIACGKNEKLLKAAADMADTLLDAMEKRFGLAPDGPGRLRIVRRLNENKGIVFHPQSWAYPEIVWLFDDEDSVAPPDAKEMAEAIADACAVWFDDAAQWRRWLAAGALAEASLQTKETPAALEAEVRNISPSRNVVGGLLRIAVEVSKRWGDAALGKAITAARKEGAYREGRQGRGLLLDEAMKALAKETGKEAEVEELFGR